jgi:hypothetical protein
LWQTVRGKEVQSQCECGLAAGATSTQVQHGSQCDIGATPSLTVWQCCSGASHEVRERRDPDTVATPSSMPVRNGCGCNSAGPDIAANGFRFRAAYGIGTRNRWSDPSHNIRIRSATVIAKEAGIAQQQDSNSNRSRSSVRIRSGRKLTSSTGFGCSEWIRFENRARLSKWVRPAMGVAEQSGSLRQSDWFQRPDSLQHPERLQKRQSPSKMFPEQRRNSIRHEE